MKAKLFCLVSGFLLSLNLFPQGLFTYQIHNASGSTSITCKTPSVNLIATSNQPPAQVTYTWTGPSATLTGSNVLMTSPGNYTVTASYLGALQQTNQVVSVGINTTVPIPMVSPTIQNITCQNPGTPFSLMNMGPATNVTHKVSSPYGGMFAETGSNVPYYSNGKGLYTYTLTDNVNGCGSSTTFSVNVISGVPTFSLMSSPPGFTLGCGNNSVVSIIFANAQTDPPGGALNYSVLGTGSGPNQGSFSLNIPGTYTAIIESLSQNCQLKVPFTVVKDIPDVSVVVPNNLLTCDKPSVDLIAISQTPDVGFKWLFAGIPGVVQGSACTVPNKPGSPTATLVNNYTLTVTGNQSQCSSTTLIPIYQSLFPPAALISSGGINELTCAIPTVVLTNVSVSGIPGNSQVIPPPTLPVIGFSWIGPMGATNNASTYTVGIPATYTMIAKDLNNGCTASATKVISDNRIYPVVNNPNIPQLPCTDGTTTVAVTPIISSSTLSLTYSWTAPPNATVTGFNTPTLNTSTPGVYTIFVTNSNNGCTTGAAMTVIDCASVGTMEPGSEQVSVTAYPNPSSGMFEIIPANQSVSLDIKLFSSCGMLVKEFSGPPGIFTLDLSQEPEGIYFLLVQAGQDFRFSKLIKN